MYVLKYIQRLLDILDIAKVSVLPIALSVGDPRFSLLILHCCILVDPASCHMLVSKIKPCMSKYTLWHSETANGSLNQLWFIRSCVPMWITVVILELIHATGPDFTEGRFY